MFNKKNTLPDEAKTNAGQIRKADSNIINQNKPLVEPPFRFNQKKVDGKVQRPTRLVKRIFLVSAGLIFLAFIGIFLARTIFPQSPEFISPLPEGTAVLSSKTQTPSNSKEIIGFLPFWNIDHEESQRYHLLTQVAFFALEIDADGNIKKLKADKTEEPGWTAYKSQSFGSIYRKAKESGTKVVLTIQALDSDVISSIVNDPQKRKRAIEQTLEIVKLKNLDGVNIDLEQSSVPAYTTTQNFTQFVKEFKEALSTQNPNLTLSIDVFADSVNKIRLWDIPKIAEHVDHIIIMAYDFHRSSSLVAGPIAPIRGSPKHWEYDLISVLREFSKTVPLEKLILGVAYYGYEWQTTSETPHATTYPSSGSLATYKRIQSLIAQKKPKLKWDEEALSPMLTYTDKGKIYQIYYENEVSLGIKYDLVNESGLAGIAIWALGYDGEYSNLWNLLSEKFSQR